MTNMLWRRSPSDQKLCDDDGVCEPRWNWYTVMAHILMEYVVTADMVVAADLCVPGKVAMASRGHDLTDTAPCAMSL